MLEPIATATAVSTATTATAVATGVASPALGGGLVLVAYLLGSIPTGYLIGKAKGLDVRAQGSGNIGATNTARALGKRWGIITLVGDAAKGYLPVLAGLLLGLPLHFVAAAGFAAFLGHIFPLYLKFKGGKGVATALGVLVGVAPLAALAGFVVYAILYAIWRISSIGSLSALFVVPAVIVWQYPQPEVLLLMAALATTIVWTHRGNIERLLKRKEHKV